MQKMLIITGCIFILIGLFLPWIKRISLGQLPGDIIFKREHVTFYFPIVTCLILSILVSLILWLFRK